MTLPMYGYAWRSRDNGRTGVELFSLECERDRVKSETEFYNCETVLVQSTLDLDPATLFPGIPEFETGPVEVEPPLWTAEGFINWEDRTYDVVITSLLPLSQEQKDSARREIESKLEGWARQVLVVEFCEAGP